MVRDRMYSIRRKTSDIPDTELLHLEEFLITTLGYSGDISGKWRYPEDDLEYGDRPADQRMDRQCNHFCLKMQTMNLIWLFLFGTVVSGV